MDLSQIRAFLTVCETKSFTKAAHKINMSQPSISLKIKALEKYLGAKLLIREQSNIRLTDEGSYAEEKFSEIINRIAAIEENFSQLKKNKNGGKWWFLNHIWEVKTYDNPKDI